VQHIWLSRGRGYSRLVSKVLHGEQKGGELWWKENPLPRILIHTIHGSRIKQYEFEFHEKTMQNAHQKCPFASAVLATDAVANALSNVHGYSVSQLHVKNLKCARGQDDTPAAGVGTVRDYQAKFGYEHIISALEYQREALSKPQVSFPALEDIHCS
jgi:hypothetical protein